jgi:hypothetical protein
MNFFVKTSTLCSQSYLLILRNYIPVFKDHIYRALGVERAFLNINVAHNVLLNVMKRSYPDGPWTLQNKNMGLF